jgi:methionyl-tRNA formyltransferase
LQPVKLKDTDFLAQLQSYQADVFVVIAFRMLPEAVWTMPAKGTFNVHASLLPQYRGAAPINWAVMNNEKESGVTTFLLNHDIDAGAIIAQRKIALSSTETAGTLHDRLCEEGKIIALDTLKMIENNQINPIDQSNINVADLKMAPKIFKPDCKIDFNQSCEQIDCKVRGLSPYPAAFFEFTHKEEALSMKVFEIETVKSNHNQSAGTFVSDYKHELKIACADGWIILKDIQLMGKKRMGIEEFLRGFRFDSEQLTVLMC